MVAERYGSSVVDPAPLAQQMQLHPSGRVVKNRFMKAPMAEGLASWSPKVPTERGIPTDELVDLYRRWGEGENSWGLIVTGNIETDSKLIAAPGDMIITPEFKPEGERFEMFKKVAAAGKANGSVMVAQITHPGRQLQHRVSQVTVAPSDVPMSAERNGVKYAKPHAATRDEIAHIIEGFAYAAEYLEKAGFDGVELHAAHGYLLSQFLSRATNKRTDEYGAQTMQSRLRFISDVGRAIKSRVSPSFIVGAKLNSVEFQDSGVNPEEAQELCRALEDLGFDFVELSGGTVEKLGMDWTKDSTRRREAFFLEFAEAITKTLGSDSKLKVYLTGGFRSAEAMVKGLNAVHGIGIGRPAAAEPRLSRDILEGRVTGSIKPLEEFENNLMGGLAIAGAQIAQIGQGNEPLNYGNAEVIKTMKADMELWWEKTVQDGNKLEYVRPPRYSGPQAPYQAVLA
ncbi:NADH oxidase [Colletotrichum plurivorum]|uniref:NADH oxidase n=1 Tax=Colletotrichum plurivorum TaxID=2175906 RepID=A0A8H6KF06_9PEZI|nr:NADH oxidase [Colletotrichum plurivorum]